MLIARYAADAAARNNLALCQTHLRHMPQAVQEMRQVVKILPYRALYRENLALYEDYAGEFAVAEQQVRGCRIRACSPSLPCRLPSLGRNACRKPRIRISRLPRSTIRVRPTPRRAWEIFRMVEGRFSDAADILAKGAGADLAAGDTDRAAAKFAALGRAQLARGRSAQALTAADKALANSKTVRSAFLPHAFTSMPGRRRRGWHSRPASHPRSRPSHGRTPPFSKGWRH